MTTPVDLASAPADAPPIDVLSFGEALVDFLPAETGRRLREVSAFRPCLGGAPANLAYTLARLGVRAAFASKLGSDEFGHMIMQRLAEVGCDTRAVTLTREARTGITFVQIGPQGERSFLFYRMASAEVTLKPGDLALEGVIPRCRIVNVGSNLLMHELPRRATLDALDAARAAGCLVSMDANIRVHLWADREAIRPTLFEALRRVDLLKINEEERAFLFGVDLDPADALREHLAPLGVRALVQTLGGEGAAVATVTGARAQAPAPAVEAVDTTGAGDGFLAGLLAALTRVAASRAVHPRVLLDALDGAQWRPLLGVANFVGAAVCTALGATTAAPGAEEVPWALLDPLMNPGAGGEASPGDVNPLTGTPT